MNNFEMRQSVKQTAGRGQWVNAAPSRLVQKSVERHCAIVVKPGFPACFGHAGIFNLAESDPVFTVLAPCILALFYALAINGPPMRNAAGLGALISSGFCNFLLAKFVLCILW
jgi:hypothetical protein